MTKRKRSDRDLADEIATKISREATPGAEARDLLRRAYDAGDYSVKAYYLARAQRAIARLDPARQGRLIRELQGHVLALQGRSGDSRIAHVTPGETVIPRELQSPELLRVIFAEARRQGIDPASLFVGNRRNAINPATGHMEFDEEELEDQAPASNDDAPAPGNAPTALDDTSSPAAPPIVPTNNLRDMADQIVEHINNQSDAAAPNASACQLVPPGGQFKTAKGVIPIFQPQMASSLTTAIQNLNGQGIVPTMTDGYRTQAMEDAQRAAKAAGKNSNPVAKGISPHQVGLGVDFGPNSNGPHNDAIHGAMTSAGLLPGAVFNDPPHYYTPDAPRNQTDAIAKACEAAYARFKPGS